MNKYFKKNSPHIKKDNSDISTSADTLKSNKPESGLERFRDYYFSSLLVCFIGIIGCYTQYGVLQESLLADKSLSINTNFVLGVQSFFSTVISLVIISAFNMGSITTNATVGDGIVGILNFMTMFFSNTALKHVSYPFMVLSKSAKILPVIFAGWIRGVYVLTWS
jgi:hypothetical protein